ncbi:uncharacterized protein LOC124540870 isoform X1 [Vanessa cardui]|uniref:uncharacterized protein LOC124540870 isoform X1 n=1 Tax=Vanessa cardui TaxID=171605 RepID=UPI001F13E702|nr:uncharacterized protein LOC124540870 isoform X1 [Vanessa cardui]
MDKSKIPSKGQDCHNSQNGKISHQKYDDKIKRSSKNSRTTKFCQFCSTTRSTKLSSTAKVHTFNTKSSNQKISAHSKCLKRTDLVDSKLSFIHGYPLPASDKLLDNGRVRPGMGRTTQQYDCLGHLVKRGTDNALQLKRDASHTLLNPKPDSIIKTQFCTHSKRQQNNCLLSTERRRDKITTANRNHTSNFESFRSEPDTFQHSLHTREIQQSCRSPFTPSTPTRMAPVTSLSGVHICKMGNPCCRSVCLCKSSHSPQLCVSRSDRQTSPISRRIQFAVELPTRVGVSATISDPESSNALKPVDRNISNCSSSMGESILASRPQGESINNTNNTEEPTGKSSRHIDGTSTSPSREHHPGGLEMWGWSEALEVKQNLLHAQ